MFTVSLCNSSVCSINRKKRDREGKLGRLLGYMNFTKVIFRRRVNGSCCARRPQTFYVKLSKLTVECHGGIVYTCIYKIFKIVRALSLVDRCV